ncbi:GTP cyclohydrolase FolE2 [Cedecea davisae]|uniref:GTP cyclohydrolase FolE2 n=1 Tax=Cedecea davisae TaxID=158484 RepID=UPI002430A5D3|nr:GTP cyclohydrolase FolE2 [Cedecea davisae]
MTVTPALCPKTLPDIQSLKGEHSDATLSWVGMEKIDLPVEIAGRPLTAKVSAGINLLSSPEAEKGIHMSRLYLLLDALTQQEVTPASLRNLLGEFLVSHQRCSNMASIMLSGDLLLSRKSLTSNRFGWKAYPVQVQAERGSDFTVTVRVGIPYSSTCPASAALSRNLAQQQFQLDFGERSDRLSVAEVEAWLGERGMPGTPHSQRSWAWVSCRLKPDARMLPFIDVIDCCETALATAVQTVVKRADEQAFALANGQNLMFCEDAARRLNQALLGSAFCSAFEVRVEHQESLHAHNAVARINWTGNHYAA